MTPGSIRTSLITAVLAAIVGGLAGGGLVAMAVGERLDAAERQVTTLDAQIAAIEGRADDIAAVADGAAAGVRRINDGVVRIKLTDALEPPSRFGGIQAFVQTGSTEHGCIASVSETNVGNLGPFYVLCTPRGPVIDGVARKGVLLQIRTANAGGRSDQLFPPGSIVEITLWQPGATMYGNPVPCAIGAPQQC